MKVAFLGLGTMGYSMAAHQIKAGLDVCVFNRTTVKAEHWASEHNGRCALTPAQAVADADIIMSCLGNDDDVAAVLLDEELSSAIKTGAIIVDHTTTSADLALTLQAHYAKIAVNFLDAPVSGGQAGAESGQLTVMVGGDQAVLDKAMTAITPYAKKTTLIGPVGSGQTAKMVNQVLIAGVLQGLSEGVTLAKKAGLDMDALVCALSDGAAGSWQLDNRAKTMAADEFDFGFAIDWMHKDLRFCLDKANQLDIELPNTEAVYQRYSLLQSQGYNRSDTSVLIKAFGAKID